MQRFGNLLICRRGFSGLLVLAVLHASLAMAQSSSEELWVPGEYIVKYNQEKLQEIKRVIPGLETYSDAELKEALTSTLGAEKKEELSLIQAESIKAVEGNEIDVDAAVDLLDSELVDYIAPNYIRTINRVPNDPSFSSLWGLHQANDIDINAPEAWDNLTDDSAKDIIVGVVDTGVDYNHPDLAANMWVNTIERNGQTGVDDDGNGVIDDIHGYNAINGSGNPMDDHNHGTHCSGTIGGVGNNGIGVTGVAWKVKIMALKFLSSSGSGSDTDAIKAINYAVAMRNRGGQLKVLSNSWGGGGSNPAMLAAIQAANAAGILFVAAAGNAAANNDTGNFFPANYNSPNVISVAAIAQDGSKASFSNYGVSKVTLAAPGVGIYSTVRNNGYASFNGTSMATPHVAGVAALVFAKVPQFMPQDVRAQLMATVKPLSSLNGLMLAPGVVNARDAIADPSNYPPELFSIGNQTVAPNTRVKTVPLLAVDREDDALTYSAKVVLPAAQAAAADLDTLYNFTRYLPQNDNYYHIGEKHILTSTNKTFFIFSDGGVWELIYPYYYYRATVSPEYYQDPNLLVNASSINASSIATLSVLPNSPAELRIDVNPSFKGSFTVKADVSDGNRSDSESFTVTLQAPGSCL